MFSSLTEYAPKGHSQQWQTVELPINRSEPRKIGPEL
jgi:hypothetical protein